MRGRQFIAVVAAVIALVAVTPALGNAAITRTAPATNIFTLAGAINAGETATNLPSSLTPTLASVFASPHNESGLTYLKASCDPYDYPSEAAKPAPCFYGDVKAKRTLVLFGDSFVGNWIPALDAAAVTMRYRVALFGFYGCVAPLLTTYASGPGFSPSEAAACLLWHKQLGKAVKALNPVAVLAANGSPSWGVSGDQLWIKGIKAAFDAMHAPTSPLVEILLGTGPHFDNPGPACVAAHPTQIGACSYKIASATSPLTSYTVALARDSAAATADHLHLISTEGWVCQRGLCPPVVNKLLVDVDGDHLSTAYSLYLTKVLTSALAPLVPR